MRLTIQRNALGAYNFLAHSTGCPTQVGPIVIKPVRRLSIVSRTSHSGNNHNAFIPHPPRALSYSLQSSFILVHAGYVYVAGTDPLHKVSVRIFIVRARWMHAHTDSDNMTCMLPYPVTLCWHRVDQLESAHLLTPGKDSQGRGCIIHSSTDFHVFFYFNLINLSLLIFPSCSEQL